MLEIKVNKNNLTNKKMEQMQFFGYDNLTFRTINLVNPQKLINICKFFRLKKIIKKKSLPLNCINI